MIDGFVLDESINLPSRDIAKGDRDHQPFNLGNLRMLPSICYEDIFGSDMLDFFPQSNVIINITNNAWFGKSIALPAFTNVRMRAQKVEDIFAINQYRNQCNHWP